MVHSFLNVRYIWYSDEVWHAFQGQESSIIPENADQLLRVSERM